MTRVSLVTVETGSFVRRVGGNAAWLAVGCLGSRLLAALLAALIARRLSLSGTSL